MEPCTELVCVCVQVAWPPQRPGGPLTALCPSRWPCRLPASPRGLQGSLRRGSGGQVLLRVLQAGPVSASSDRVWTSLLPELHQRHPQVSGPFCPGGASWWQQQLTFSPRLLSHPSPVCPADMEPLFKDKVSRSPQVLVHRSTGPQVPQLLRLRPVCVSLCSQIFRDVCCHREIMALKVHCRSEANGCQEQMRLQQIPVRSSSCTPQAPRAQLLTCVLPLGPPERVSLLRGSLSAG